MPCVYSPYTSGIQEMDPPAVSRPQKSQIFKSSQTNLDVFVTSIPNPRFHQQQQHQHRSSDLRSRTHVKVPRSSVQSNSNSNSNPTQSINSILRSIPRSSCWKLQCVADPAQKHIA